MGLFKKQEENSVDKALKLLDKYASGPKITTIYLILMIFFIYISLKKINQLIENEGAPFVLEFITGGYAAMHAMTNIFRQPILKEKVLTVLSEQDIKELKMHLNNINLENITLGDLIEQIKIQKNSENSSSVGLAH